MAEEGQQPASGGGNGAPAVIIIKKKNRGGGHGHHGGAWKVAYADFVTAMMAFFLLLWLLAVSTEEQKSGIAHYFNPPNNSTEYGGGQGILGGASPMDQSEHAPSEAPPMPKQDESNSEDLAVSASEDAFFKNIAEQLKKAVMNIPELQAMVENMVIDITPEGLRLQVTDTEKRPLFEGQSARMYAYTEQMMAILATVLAPLPNKLALGGHTDVVPLQSVQPAYTNWELSVDRAQTMRRVLLKEGIPEPRISRVGGYAAQDLLLRDQPTNPRNRRLSIIVLRSQRGIVAAFGENGLTTPPSGENLR